MANWSPFHASLKEGRIKGAPDLPLTKEKLAFVVKAEATINEHVLCGRGCEK